MPIKCIVFDRFLIVKVLGGAFGFQQEEGLSGSTVKLRELFLTALLTTQLCHCEATLIEMSGVQFLISHLPSTRWQRQYCYQQTH